MALVFKPQFDGDTAEAYSNGTDTGIRRFLVGRDNGSGDFDLSGAIFTGAEFASAGGYDEARQQARLFGNTSVDRVRVGRQSPHTLLVEVYESNNGYYGLLEPTEPTDAGLVYNFSTREEQFVLPYLVDVSVLEPASGTLGTQKVERQDIDTTPITSVDIEVTVTNWRFGTEISLVNQLTNSLHRINGQLYRFRGSSFARSIGTDANPLFLVRYTWDYDVGSRTPSQFVNDDGTTTSPYASFTNPAFGGVTFAGTWARPPYTKIGIGRKSTTIQTILGPLPGFSLAPGYQVQGVLGNETTWSLLPGQPIQ